jgi:hypothetical protein
MLYLGPTRLLVVLGGTTGTWLAMDLWGYSIVRCHLEAYLEACWDLT